MAKTPKRVPTFALALAGGGARGLAHIAVLEALDEVGLRPAAIAGASMGAAVGAAYAAGFSGAALRAHALKAFRSRADVMTKLFRSRIGSLGDILQGGNPVMIDAEILLAQFWPRQMPARFADLGIPFTAVAVDFHASQPVYFSEGKLAPAVAASMAVPGMMKPVEIGGRPHIDGGILDNLPVAALRDKADFVIAIDVSPAPVEAHPDHSPQALEALLGAFQMAQAALTRKLIEDAGPKVIVIQPDVGKFRLTDYFEAEKILQAAGPAAASVKSVLRRRIP